MKVTSLSTFLLILFSVACVDQIDYDFGDDNPEGIVVDGYISDQPGPYTVKITRPFDIQSKLSFRTALSARKVTVADNLGNEEVLTEVQQGIYKTSPTGIRGAVGNAYRLKVELKDGRIYESIPDTIVPTGRVDTIFHEFRRITFDSVAKPTLDVYFNASIGNGAKSKFMWNLVGTYKVDTNPELYDTICAEGRCPKPLRCSGYQIAQNQTDLEYFGPCTCCTCWVNFFNVDPIVSDNLVVEGEMFKKVRATYIPVNQWTFKYRVHLEVRQLSLSERAFAFWRAAKAQRSAVTSLFQPVNGRIPSNFVQVAGTPGEVQGIFFATAISSKMTYINRDDLPKFFTIPPIDPPIKNSCLRAFANSSLQEPAFWLD